MKTSEYIRLLVRLSRAKMTTISAVTHLASCIMITNPTNPFSASLFFRIWLFILLTQFTTHFLGEIYDLQSDKLNRFATPITGGSRVLTRNKISSRHALHLAIFTLILSLSTLLIIPAASRPVALLCLFLATQYSAPPLLFNHHGLGELIASFITSILVPLLSANASTTPLHHLKYLLLPPTFAKFALFLALNQADRRPDWASNKRTLPVLLGYTFTARLHALFLLLPYITAILFALHDISHRRISQACVLIFFLPGLSVAIKLATSMFQHPYKLHSLLPHVLLHPTLLVWAVLIHALLHHIPEFGLLNSQTLLAAFFAFLTLRAFRAGSRPAKKQSHKTTPPKPATHPHDRDVTIIGAGISGLISAITLKQQGITVLVLERLEQSVAHHGADVTLWPSAISALRALGISNAFFNSNCMPLRRVHVRSAHDGASETLHTLDMDAVSRGCAHGFMHVSRRLLMCELRALLHKEDILYETCVLGIEEHEMKQLVTVSYVQPNSSKAVKFVTSRVLIGADGAGSFTRTFVAGGSQGGGGFSGEVCYRGIVNFKALQKEGRDVSVLKRLLKRDGDGDVMRIDCGAGIHSSYGFLNRSNDMAYWWVKMVAREMQPMEKFRLHCSHVLNMLKDASAKEDCHQVEVEERGGAKRWCTPRIALIGDAAHVIPQKLGFASSLAIEDAFVLATLLATFWQWPDGHLEAFYEFESCRRPHVEGIVKEVTCWLLLGKISRRTAVWMRDFLIRCVPVCMLQYVLRKHCFDIEPHVMNFKKTAQRVVTNRVN